MEESGKRVVDERLRAIDKRTGKYVNVIKRTIDDSLFPIVKYLSYSYNELNYDYVKNLNFDVDVNWEQRRYQIVKDLLSNNFDGRKMKQIPFKSMRITFSFCNLYNVFPYIIIYI